MTRVCPYRLHWRHSHAFLLCIHPYSHNIRRSLCIRSNKDISPSQTILRSDLSGGIGVLWRYIRPRLCNLFHHRWTLPYTYSGMIPRCLRRLHGRGNYVRLMHTHQNLHTLPLFLQIRFCMNIEKTPGCLNTLHWHRNCVIAVHIHRYLRMKFQSQ